MKIKKHGEIGRQVHRSDPADKENLLIYSLFNLIMLSMVQITLHQMIK
jgi:hypothetical protein